MGGRLNLYREYDYDAKDLAVAFYSVATELYGAESLSGLKRFGIFEKTSLNFLSVPTGLKEQAQGIMGPVKIKQLSGHFQVCSQTQGGPVPDIIVVKVKPSDQKEVERLLDAVKEHLDKHSIYRGKAITVNGEFLDLSEISMNDVVYNEKVERSLEAHVWTIIEEWKLCASTLIGLTRKVVFEGKYGSGKTLAALLTAKLAVKMGWTFFYMPPTSSRDTAAIQRVMFLAKKYQRSVVFFEDVEREQRDGNVYAAGSILSAIDGLSSKSAQVLVIMTTNNIEKVNEGMQRPGRTDRIISFSTFTAKDIERLLTLAIPSEWLDDEIDWNEVYKLCEGFSQSFVLEVGKSGMLFAINAWKKNGREGKPRVKESDLKEAAQDLQVQHKKSNERFGFTKPI